MQDSYSPALVSAVFDDPKLVSCAGLAPVVALAAGKARTDAALGNPVLVTEGKVTFVDGLLASGCSSAWC